MTLNSSREQYLPRQPTISFTFGSNLNIPAKLLSWSSQTINLVPGAGALGVTQKWVDVRKQLDILYSNHLSSFNCLCMCAALSVITDQNLIILLNNGQANPSPNMKNDQHDEGIISPNQESQASCRLGALDTKHWTLISTTSGQSGSMESSQQVDKYVYLSLSWSKLFSAVYFFIMLQPI